MISTFLVEHAALVPVALLVLALVCVVLGYVGLRNGRRVLWVLVALSVLPVFALTLVRTGRRMEGFLCTVQFDLPRLGSVELLANVALFFAPVHFATLATRHPLWTVAAGATLSAAIELAQALVPAIGRACDTNDWLMNTIGAVLGALVAAFTVRLHRSRTPS